MPAILKIYHGPLIYVSKQFYFGLAYAETEMEIPATVIRKFEEIFTLLPNKIKAKLNLFINFKKQSTIKMNIDKLKMVNKAEPFTWEVTGFNSNTIISPLVDNIKSKTVIDKLHTDIKGLAIDLNNVTGENDLHLYSKGIYLGNAKVAFPTINGIEKGKKIFSVNNLLFEFNSNIDNKLYNLIGDITIQSILSDSRSYGPLAMKISFSNLDADIIADIINRLSRVPQDKTAYQAYIKELIMVEFPKIFSKGAKLAIPSIDLKIDEDKFNASLFIKYPNGITYYSPEFSQQLVAGANLQMPQAFIKNIIYYYEFRALANNPALQQALIEQLQSAQLQTLQLEVPNQKQLALIQADKLIKVLEQKGILLTQGADFIIKMNLEQGKFMLNGKIYH
jgi:uncharacterized protein YdgA (DUF945 family)